MSMPPTISPDTPPDWLDLQFALRAPWQEFFAPRRAACQRAAASRHLGEEAEIDAAVRSFARGGGWPPLTEPEKCLLGARVHFAFCLITAHCASEAQPIVAISTTSEEEALEWLLIEAWHNGGAALFAEMR